MKETVLALFCSLLLTGCASFKPATNSPPQIISIPELGVSAEAELGETVIAKGKVFPVKGVKLMNHIEATWGGMSKYKFAPGFYAAYMQDSKWIYYNHPNQRAEEGALAVSKTNVNHLTVATFAVATTYHLEPQPTPQFELSSDSLFGADSFKQELIYNGKTGNTLKFLYRELSGDTLRFPFNQEVQYDLAESNTIGFKGARIEIESATNTKIKYKVIKNFPDRGQSE